MTLPADGPALDCASARPLIDAYLLDELASADSQRLAAHIRACAACAAELGGSVRLLSLLSGLPTPSRVRISTNE